MFRGSIIGAAVLGAAAAMAGAGDIAPVRTAGPQPKRLRLVDHSRYPGHVLREIRASTKRQACECARRRRQAERVAQRGCA